MTLVSFYPPIRIIILKIENVVPIIYNNKLYIILKFLIKFGLNQI